MASVQRWTTCPKCNEVTFDATSYTSGEFYGLCMYCGYYHVRTFKNEDDFEEGFVVDEGGGFGVETIMKGNCGYTRSLVEGEIPEITENTVFVSALIDGKLVVLKEPGEE